MNNPDEVRKITAEQIADRKESLTKNKEDAIQKQSTEKVDVSEQTKPGERVGEGDPQVVETTIESEETTKAPDTKTPTQEEVAVQEEATDLQTLLEEQEKQFLLQKLKSQPKKQQ